MTDQAIQPDPKMDALQKASADIEQIVSECGLMSLRNRPVLIQTITLGKGIRALQAVLTKAVVEAYFSPLQNTKLGFLTDKKEGYPWEVVRDCVIEGMLRGFRPIGNEMNIIADNFYGAKNGYERNVREFPGLRELVFDLAVPVLSDKGALVAFEARWVLDGEPMELVGREAMPATDKTPATMDTRIPVKVNAGMGSDAIMGKAKRKMLARIYERVTGVATEVIESEPGEGGSTITVPGRELPAPVDSSQDGRRISMKGAKSETNGTPAAAAAADPKAQVEPGATG